MLLVNPSPLTPALHPPALLTPSPSAPHSSLTLHRFEAIAKGIMLSKKETCWCADGCMRAPPSLDPAAREERSDAVDAELKALIFAHYLEKLARSPHQRDRMRRFVSRHVWEEEQALILSETYDALCARPLPTPSPARPLTHARRARAAGMTRLRLRTRTPSAAPSSSSCGRGASRRRRAGAQASRAPSQQGRALSS